VWVIPSWAIGTAFVICVVACAQVVVRRLIGSTDKRAGQNPTEQALEDMQRRLAELEERMDFAERLLAKERTAERLSPPHG